MTQIQWRRKKTRKSSRKEQIKPSNIEKWTQNTSLRVSLKVQPKVKLKHIPQRIHKNTPSSTPKKTTVTQWRGDEEEENVASKYFVQHHFWFVVIQIKAWSFYRFSFKFFLTYIVFYSSEVVQIKFSLKLDIKHSQLPNIGILKNNCCNILFYFLVNFKSCHGRVLY